MLIYLHKLQYYFLTCNNETRRSHMLNEFKDFNLTEVNPVTGIGKNKSAITGISRIMDLANKKFGNNFEPFVMLEDDVKILRSFPEYVEIPDDADILYIGLSSCSLSSNGTLYYEFIYRNSPILKIYNMLASHGIVICSLRGMMMYQKALFESYYTDEPWDVLYAKVMPLINVYATKNPLVYQCSLVGGEQNTTKLALKNIRNRICAKIPEYEKHESLCSMTIYPNKYCDNTTVLKNSEDNTDH